jgi:quinoprotein glucose dehydrogenase
MYRLCTNVAVLLSLTLLGLVAAQPPQRKVESDQSSQEARLSTSRIQLVEGQGLKVELHAAEPLLANPVAFCFDPQGRIYVAETYRLHQGVTDNRSHMNWLDDDIACQTVADRDAKYRKHLKSRYAEYEKASDRVRLLIDTKGTGKPDTSYVFSDGYRRAVDGLGSGVLVHEGNVYFTCIPDLYRLKDTRGIHQADVRESLSTGYGVHTSFIGHDLHGIVVSPVDGRLYFSIGDRGANLITKEGTAISVPHTGAVFRCNLDGTELELYAKGLRNPQELAFDDVGNLFTGDNNSDSGDRARFVYLPEGADCGWHIGFQYLEQPYSRGPWNAEFMWHPPRPEQPAFIVPPITNLGDGPSGLTYYPGTGLPERYREHFFLADFRAMPTNSGIRSFAVKPKGAGFELIDSHQFAWGVVATDVEFGPDGGLYILDWVEGWGMTGKGRIHRVFHQASKDAGTRVKELLASDWSKKSDHELGGLLSHTDRRVRMQAQFTLAKRTNDASTAVLKTHARQNKSRVARLHAIWSLGQQPRAQGTLGDTAYFLKQLLGDSDDAVVINTLRVLARGKLVTNLTPEEYAALFRHPNDHVKAQAAVYFGRDQQPGALPLLLELIRSTQLRDPWLRHACVMGLAPFHDKLGAGDKDAAVVRLACVLAKRHLNLAPDEYLKDSDLAVRSEAIRACHDLFDRQGMEALADVAVTREMTEPVQLRLLNASFLRGSRVDAERLARFAANAEMPLKVRTEAVKMLAAWEKAPGRDWVLGLWRPVEKRSPEVARDALSVVFSSLLAQKRRLAAEAIKAAAQLRLDSLAESILKVVSDRDYSPEARVAALQSANTFQTPGLEATVKNVLQDSDHRVRSAAQGTLAKLNPTEAVAHLRLALEKGELRERQAVFAELASMRIPEADRLLEGSLKRFADGTLPAELELDMVEALKKRSNESWRALLESGKKRLAQAGPYAEYRTTLHGGDLEAGRKVFFEKTAVACLRCHRVGKEGGEVGPVMTGIGHEKTRDYLLEAIVDPNKTIAKGFELSIILTQDGVVQQGVVKAEDENEIRLITPEAKTVVIKKADIEDRKTGKSAMPDDIIKQLSLRELRDLIEYLATLK